MPNLLFFFILFSFCFSEELDFDNYFNNNREQDSQENNAEENDCSCDINRHYCNYLCCCDKKCDSKITDDWEQKLKCIDKKDTIGIFSDRCIDKNLVYAIRERRGLHKTDQTEDISINSETIHNYCFSIDNSNKMKKKSEPINLGDQEKNDILEAISVKSGINNNNLRRLNDDNSTSNNDNDNNKLYYNNNSGIIIMNYGAFNSSNEEFALYSGENCVSSAKVKLLKNVNYTCSMNKSTDLTKTIIKAINNDNHPKIIYTVKDSLLSIKGSNENIQINENNEIILEVEFILINNNNEFNNISDYSINIVKINKNEIEGDKFSFKNSVIFSNNVSKIPYRYSGTIGYIVGNPLKVVKNKTIFNEFYISGKYKNGSCRFDNNEDDFLYYDDKPILFNQDFSYSCSYNNTINIINLNVFTLVKKLNNSLMIGKYGNSYNNEQDWITVENNMNLNDIKSTLIKLDIYLGTKKIGVYSYKYVYRAILKNIENERNNTSLLSLDINYHDLDEQKEYEITPELPAFIPSMPPDLLDPLIYSDVDK